MGRDRPPRPDDAERAAAATRAPSCCCRRPSPARRRARCSTTSAPPSRRFRHVVYDPTSLIGAARGQPARLRRRGRAALPLRPGARRRRAGGGLPRHLAVAGRVRAAVRAAARTADADARASTSSSNRGCRSPAATPTCGWRSPRRSWGRSRSALLAAVARRAGRRRPGGRRAGGLERRRPHAAEIDRVADALVRHRGESLVVTRQRRRRRADRGRARSTRCSATSARPSISAHPSLQGQGDDGAMAALIDDMARGAVRALMIWGANPVYDHPDGGAFAQGAGQGAAVDLVRRSARRDRRPRPRALPRSPLPRVVGRRRAGARATSACASR